MSGAIISTVQLTPTHDGETALVVRLRFTNGGCSSVQIDAEGLRQVMSKANIDNALELIGQPWTVLDVLNPTFVGAKIEESQ